MSSAWERLLTRCETLADLRSVAFLCEWDQQVMLPRQGAASRADQSALLARLHHERLTDPQLADLVAEVAHAPADDTQRAVTRLLTRQIDRATRVEASLVDALSRAQSEAFGAWITAKKSDDFPGFAKPLERVFDLKRQVAAAIDPQRHVYDVLLEEYEPGATHAELVTLFSRLREGLVQLLDATRDLPQEPPIEGEYDLARQEALHRELVVALGYDLDAGRLDFSEHPFTVPISRGDIRITTHLYAHDLLMGLGGTIHETGHALYEQGIPRDLRGTGLDDAASLGLHESQSRFWENAIGRSRPFQHWIAPLVRRHLGSAPDPDRMFRAANPVRPTLIRIFADEATYNLHILLRFELETALLSGDLPVADLPGAWTSAMQDLLGVTPPDDRQGCLQDVHWATGAIGYFPTYTLGNLYAASLGRALERDEPTLWDDVRHGRFEVVLSWLRRHVHQHGHAREARDLVHAATGPADGVEDLLDHLWARQGELHGISRPR